MVVADPAAQDRDIYRNGPANMVGRSFHTPSPEPFGVPS